MKTDTYESEGAAKVALSVNEVGMGTVSVNGMDLGSHVYRVEVTAECGEATEVRLCMKNVEVEVDAGGAPTFSIESAPEHVSLANSRLYRVAKKKTSEELLEAIDRSITMLRREMARK